MTKTRVALLGAGLALASGAANAAGAEFDWLAGHWCGGTEQRKIEEVWLPQAGGALLGMSRTLSGDSLESFEFNRLVPSGKDAGFHVQPNRVPATVLTHTPPGRGWVVFENPAHDFPNRIEYRSEGDALYAVISGPVEDSKQHQIRFDYRRCPPLNHRQPMPRANTP